MFHFQEKVCLIQLAIKKKIWIIDPLIIKDLSSLKPIFSNLNIRKISHGSDYDIRSLYRDFNIEINNLFDTHIACRLLGFQETGLNSVLKNILNITVDKKYQKKDWSQRPLPEDMLNYAALDVAFLIELSDILEKKLIEKGRLSWLLEECEILTGVRPTECKEEPLFLKFKGAGILYPKNLAVLESLLLFRQNIAQKKDKPLFKIIGNRSLLKMALASPVSIRQLKETRLLSSLQVKIYGDRIVKLIKESLNIKKKDLPSYPRKKAQAQSPGIKKRINSLKIWRDKKAISLNIDPSLVLNKAAIISLASKPSGELKDLKKIKGMKEWQKKEFGRQIIDNIRKT